MLNIRLLNKKLIASHRDLVLKIFNRIISMDYTETKRRKMNQLVLSSEFNQLVTWAEIFG